MRSFLVAVMLFGFAAEAAKSVRVRMHTRKNGSLVMPHTRSPPKAKVNP